MYMYDKIYVRTYCMYIYLLHLLVYRLQLFQRFEKFRIIVFGGDGSVGWVLSAVDRFNLHSKVCTLGGCSSMWVWSILGGVGISQQ